MLFIGLVNVMDSVLSCVVEIRSEICGKLTSAFDE